MVRRWSYTALAMAMAAGAPLGLAAVRALARRSFALAEAAADLRGDPITYGYVTVSTAIAFAGFGYVLGTQADRLLERSLQDPLTGLGNWRLMQDRTRQAVAGVHRHGRPLALLLFDLDGLKAINDAHGHAAGSAALVRLGETLRRGARADDTTARWGGDEFALLAPDTDLEQGIALGERLRVQLDQRVRREGGAHFTVSVGVAGLAPPVSDLERVAARLWEDADAALYAAKKKGGNCVCPPGRPGISVSGGRTAVEEGSAMNEQELQLFRESVTRCVADPAFLQTFYDRFIGSSDEVRGKFKGTDLQVQKRALADSLFSLAVALQGNDKSASWRELDRVARRHGHADQDIRPELYDLWMARLMESAALHDPQYTPEVEAAWRSALGKGIAFMRARYQG